MHSPYQINIDFGMTQSSSTSITGHHSGFNISHWLFRHQFYSKVLVHLNTNSGAFYICIHLYILAFTYFLLSSDEPGSSVIVFIVDLTE